METKKITHVVRQWFKTSEGRPEKDGNYLVVIKRGWGDNIEMVYCYANLRQDKPNWQCDQYPITHWMELPPPPKDVDISNLLGPNEVFIKVT
jgi:hypothetical protein